MSTQIGCENVHAKRAVREKRASLGEIPGRARISLLFPCRNRLRVGLWLAVLIGLLAGSPGDLFVSPAMAAQATGDSAEVKLPRPKIISRKRIALPPREGMTGYKAPRKKVAASVKAMQKATKAEQATNAKAAKKAPKAKKARKH